VRACARACERNPLRRRQNTGQTEGQYNLTFYFNAVSCLNSLSPWINRGLRERIVWIREHFSNLVIFISYLTREDMKSLPKDMKEEYKRHAYETKKRNERL
jgi:hypothetical protein